MGGSVHVGMLWAGILLIAVPLVIGIGVAVIIARRHRAGRDESGSPSRVG